MGRHGTGKIEKNCEVCHKSFSGRIDRPSRFCSKTCSSSAKPRLFLRIKKNCLVCGNEFEVKKYRKETALYCSNECRRKRMPFKDSHINWKGGVSERPYKVRKKIKQLVELHGRCSDCNGNDNLQGHHIQSYSDFPELGCNDDNIVYVVIVTPSDILKFRNLF
jgi:hypothetical protein